MKNANNLVKAKAFIAEYCVREFGEDAKADFSDLSKIPIAYTTTEDEKHEIQVYVNLVDYRIETLVDDKRVQTERYSSLEEMIENALPYLSFDELVCVDEDELKTVDDLIADATARSKAGDEVGMEKLFDGF